jgi:outer membrane protein OmpA-like peptidoglycan-associated protein
MSDDRVNVVLVGVLAAVLAVGCGRWRVAGPPSPPSPELFVLLPADDNGAIGSASVSTPAGTVDLIGERSATGISAGRAPTTPVILPEVCIQRVFGGALTALPLPPVFFNLYFQAGSDELTDESRAKISEVLQVVARRPAPDVAIIGHTDTIGDAKSNVELGLERAEAVRNLLVQAGLDPSLTEVTSHGEADLLVPTPDETPEPRNRRVEIAVR